MGIRIEQVDIKSLNTVFPMKDEINGFISIVEDLDSTLVEIRKDVELKADISDLSKVATSGSYNDLLDKPENIDAESVGGKTVNDEVQSTDTLWTSEKIVTFIKENNNDQDEIINKLVDDMDDANVEINRLKEGKADKTELSSLDSNIKLLLKEKADKTQVEELKQQIELKADVSTIDEIRNELDNKVSSLQLEVLNNRIDEKADKIVVNEIESQLSTFAKKSDTEYLSKLVPTLATKESVASLKSEVKTKAEQEDIERLDKLVNTKLDKAEFELLKDEVYKARRGKYTLLDKIIEIDSRLDKLTTAQTNGIVDIAIGTIVWFTGTSAPSTFKVCDGSAISRSTYSELFKVIQTTYGEGDGSTTFNLPNLVEDGRFIRSSGSTLRVGQKQEPGLTDVRDSYEGSYNTDKLYLVGGKYYSEMPPGEELEPNSIALLPCIKVEEDSSLEMDTPIGLFNWFTGEEIPEDYLECDGSEISRETYSTLFGIIGTTYGEGDGSKTFNLPDLKTDNRYVKSKTSELEVGTKTPTNVSLMDVRKAYEGENGESLTPLGGKSFSSNHEEGELIPSTIAYKPIIKVKKKTTQVDRVAIGTFTWFSINTAPAGYLVCDGSAISRYDYPELFEVIGTTYGEGDGATTFNVPNMLSENKFIRSYGGTVNLGSHDTMKLVDIREAYEGEYNNEKLFPLGAKYFSEQSIYHSIHPQNMVLLPCIKAKNVKEVDMVTLLQNLSNISTMRMNLLSEQPVTMTKTLTEKVKLTRGKAILDVSLEDLGVSNVENVFVNVLSTDKGVSHIWDINANVAVLEDKVSIYVRSLNESLTSTNVTVSLCVIYKK